MKIIGIDLGGTSLKGGLVNLEGNICSTLRLDTKNSSKEILNSIVSLIEGLSAGEEEILGIGIGTAGFIDINSGQVLSHGGNINDWAYTDIKGFLSNKFPKQRIEVDNDGNVAALCEKWLGSAKSLDSFIMLTIGTGLGGSIYTQEKIWRGHDFQAAEFGHAILYPNGRKCKCGQKGCVEKYISGSAIEDEFKLLTGRQLKGKEIFKLYNKDMDARKVIDDFAINLAVYLISLRNIFDPRGIIIGGGLINVSKYWWENMMTEFGKKVNFSGMEILPARYLNESGIIGAAKLIIDKSRC